MITEQNLDEYTDLMDKYAEEGIKIGLDTNQEFNAELIRDLTDKHRELCGLSKAKQFIVLDSPIQAVKLVPDLNPGNALYGQHDISWLQFNMFFRNECNLIEETEDIVYLYELAKLVGWMWMGNHTTIVTRKPVSLSFQPKADGLDVLHNTDDYAVKYRDGSGVYCLNGIRVPENLSWVITTPADQLDAKRVLGIENVEIRTEAMKKVGLEKFLNNINKKLIESKTIMPGGNYALYQINLNDMPELYLSGHCPSSNKFFFEAVHPECQTVASSLNWRETGIISDDYTPPDVRT